MVKEWKGQEFLSKEKSVIEFVEDSLAESDLEATFDIPP